ncbi:MAG: arsenate reductase ArsC [Desulfobulbaceae bacterium]|nr:arsenate reductase ArsC [Desulfobulbaceae bacterium]
MNQNRKRKILFLCTGNSCRSQMAEGWVKYFRKNDIESWSAGVEIHGMNRRAIQVMAEAGVDISNFKSKLVGELPVNRFDEVITLCDHANGHCPCFPAGTKKTHRPFDDPPRLARKVNSEEEILECYRRVRDEIRKFVEEL